MTREIEPTANATDSDADVGSRVLAPTEVRRNDTHDLDLVTTTELLHVLRQENIVAVEALSAVIPDLTTVIDRTVERLRAGGRLHYFGAGTSGRLAVLDAVELDPTFAFGPDRVQWHLAGGERALTSAVEGAEDDREAGSRAARKLLSTDVAIGFSAAGQAPYVVAALEKSAERDAMTVLISANPQATVLVDHHLAMPTGAEALTGSTRMKAGTAQKMLLTMFSTAVMVKLGRVHSNLMIQVRPLNDKLRFRMLRILVQATGCSEPECSRALELSEYRGPVALVMLLGDVAADVAANAVSNSRGTREALQLVIKAAM